MLWYSLIGILATHMKDISYGISFFKTLIIMKGKVILTDRQKELVDKFRNLLNQMEKENIGIISEEGYDSHYNKNELSLYFYNNSEVEDVLNIDEWDSDIYDESKRVSNSDTEKINVPIKYSIVGDWYETDDKCFFIFNED